MRLISLEIGNWCSRHQTRHQVLMLSPKTQKITSWAILLKRTGPLHSYHLISMVSLPSPLGQRININNTIQKECRHHHPYFVPGVFSLRRKKWILITSIACLLRCEKEEVPRTECGSPMNVLRCEIGHIESFNMSI